MTVISKLVGEATYSFPTLLYWTDGKVPVTVYPVSKVPVLVKPPGTLTSTLAGKCFRIDYIRDNFFI